MVEFPHDKRGYCKFYTRQLTNETEKRGKVAFNARPVVRDDMRQQQELQVKV